eukprot:scaffold2927_cov268-Chaetoceros_neogracile.AAC.18
MMEDPRRRDVKTGMVYTSNVGDSRAIFALDIHNMVEDPCINHETHVMALSIETTTDVEDERKRIEDGEGRIDGSGNVWCGPVGIVMTRALGDSVMTRAGVISTPQVKTLDLMQEVVTCRNTFKIRDCNIRVLIGSDGIFDVMSNVEANEILCDSLKAPSVSLEEGCHKLAEDARRKWKNGLPLDVRIDDTIVVALQQTFIYLLQDRNELTINASFYNVYTILPRSALKTPSKLVRPESIEGIPTRYGIGSTTFSARTGWRYRSSSNCIFAIDVESSCDALSRLSKEEGTVYMRSKDFIIIYVRYSNGTRQIG